MWVDTCESKNKRIRQKKTKIKTKFHLCVYCTLSFFNFFVSLYFSYRNISVCRVVFIVARSFSSFHFVRWSLAYTRRTCLSELETRSKHTRFTQTQMISNVRHDLSQRYLVHITNVYWEYTRLSVVIYLCIFLIWFLCEKEFRQPLVFVLKIAQLQ